MHFVLVDFQLKNFVEKNIISSKQFDLLNYVQPSSIDIPVGAKAYSIKKSILPFKTKIEQSLKSNIIEELDLTEGNILYKNNTYLIPVVDVNLPKDIYVKASPKSSIGRIDVLVRTVINGSGFFDVIPSKTKDTLWLEVTPQSFNIKIKKGIALTQLKFFAQDATYPVEDVSNIKISDSSLHYNFIDPSLEVLSIFVGSKSNTGFIAKRTNDVIDLTARDIDQNKFFEKITAVDSKENSLLLRRNHFYILRTLEKVSVPHNVSVEMLPYANMFGEMRAHYAGYFDPGFGLDIKGNKVGNYGVLEVRPFEDVTINNNQPVCLIKKYSNSAIPTKIYGQFGNTYSKQQKVRLAKYFKNT